MNRQFIFQQMRFVLGIGGFMSFYGIAALVIFVAGKYFQVRLSMQIVVFLMLLLTIPIALVGGYFFKKKKKEAKAESKEKETEETEDGKKEKPAKPSGNYAGLSTGAAEVVEFLKGSNLSAAGKDAVYSLPWYLVIGDDGSGKSSLVLASGLNFQNLPSQRQSELNLVRPTKQVDWRVTSDAVFVDTSGRYQSESDRDEWSSIVETVKKHRPRRPIDGLILAVNTEKLLQADERRIEELAKSIRGNLDDASKRLKSRFPVYLVFTHADAIEGFRDSFSVSKKDGENLVWGSTIPLEKSDNSQALFDTEFELLRDSIMKRRLIRLSAPFAPVRQLRIFNFPLHFGSARRKLGTFVSTLFRPNPFSESPFLRGFYFTAAPANLKRGRGKPGQMPRTLGDSFFTRKLFRDVILRDKDLVRTFYEQRQKPPVFGWLLTALGALVVLSLLGATALSLYNNKRLLDDAVRSGKAVLEMTQQDQGKDIFRKSPEEAQQEIDKLEDLRLQLARLDDYERNGAPISHRFGLYSGSDIYRERLLNIYYTGIERRFRQPTLARLQQELEGFSRSNAITARTLKPEQEKLLERNYDLLKAYLMLTSEYKEFAEPASLTESLEEIWLKESKLPPGNELKAKAQLDFYFKQVDRTSGYEGDPSAFPRISENKTLVKNVRDKLQAFPAYLRYLKLSVAEVTRELGTLTVDTLLQGRSKGVITGSHQISRAYTIEGYSKYMKQAFVDAATKMNKEDWVMGKESEDGQASADDLSKLQDKYFNDYTDQWRKLVRDVKIIKYKTPDDLEKGLAAFSDTDSPMKLLLTEIASNTDFSTKQVDKGWFDLSWISDWWSGSGDTGEEETANIVEREFKPLFGFIGTGEEADEKGTGISKYGAYIEDLYNSFGNISAAEKTAIGQELVKEDGKHHSVIKKVENGVTDLTRGFQTQASKELARMLQEPVTAVREYFGADARSQLGKDWAQRMVPNAREIESGYPFTADGEADLRKVTAFLNPVTGELSEFYKNRLERYFEEANGKLRVRESSDVPFDPKFVEYLNNAFSLRETLFGENASPNFEYEFRLLPVEDALIEITIDGQTLTSNETGSSKLRFPAEAGTTGVLMRFSSTSTAPLLPGSTASPADSANNMGSTVNGSSSGSLTSNYQESGSGEIRHQGTWGLFRFFNAGSPKKQPGGEYLLTYKLAGRTVKATVKPSGGDLFDTSIWRNVKAPDRILK